MKRIFPYFLWFLWITPLYLSGQNSDPVLDSLKQPLPADVSACVLAERLESILFYTTDIENDLPHYLKQLDSLFHCCILRKTGDQHFEQRLEAEIPLFQGTLLLYKNPESARLLFESSLNKFSNYGDSAGLSIAYMYMGLAASALGDSLAFASIYPKSMALARHIKVPYLLATVYNNLSISCFDFGRFAESATLSFQVLDLIDKNPTPDMLEGRSNVLSNIAGIYTRLGDNKNAKLFVQKALKAAEERHQDKSEILGQFGWTLVSDQEFQKALEVFQSLQNIPPERQTLNTISAVTYSTALCYRKLGDVKRALPFAKKGVELLPIEKHTSYGAASMLELANCEYESGLIEDALKYALLAHQTFADAKNNAGTVEATELLIAIYKSKGNYSKALEYSELRYKYQQLIERQQSTRQLAFGEFTRNAAAEKARREAEVQAQLTQQRNIRYALFAGLGILVLLTFLLYNRYRLKQRTTEQLEAKNHEVEAARSRAEASEAFKSRFLANMSHEIRTPLHGISGFTDLLLETSLSEKQRRWLSSIHHSTDRLGEVVNDILDLSKLEAGEVKLRQITFSPARVAADVQDALALRAENKGIELNLKVDENTPEAVISDPTRLYQILMNLAGNAVKFTEKGRVSLAIEGVTPSHPLNTATLQFKVTDTGIGIPPEKISTIFDSFQQAGEDTTARFGGTGLGLTIARELVHLYGSDIQVASELGKGSTFSFVLTLPLADAEALENKSAKKDTLHFAQALRILLADDNSLNLEIATEAIRRHFENAVIVEAKTGKEAVAQFQSGAFDLILMDMQMPEMTGTEATRYIRQQLDSDIPIIALTASATPEEIENALESGMNRHLGKPFKPRELAQVVAEVLALDGSVPAALAAGSRSIPAAKAAGTDLTFLRDFCDGDEVQMRHFIQKFLDQYPLEIKRMEAALEQGDREAIYQVAHSFRPQLEFVGLKKAADKALQLERGAREDLPFSTLLDLLNHIKAELKDLPISEFIF